MLQKINTCQIQLNTNIINQFKINQLLTHLNYIKSVQKNKILL
jgi:hypothetical protein